MLTLNKLFLCRLVGISRLTDDNRGVYWEVGTKDNLKGTDLNPHWFRRPQALNVETTAYALLTLVEVGKSSKMPLHLVEITVAQLFSRLV